MNPSKSPQTQNRSLQDSTQEECEPENNIIVSKPENKLSEFAKEIIRECADQPKNNVYKTYLTVLKICPQSKYTIEQIGKYLRYVRKGIERSCVAVPPCTPPLQTYPTYLPTSPSPLTNKKSFVVVESEESIREVL